MLTKFKDFSVHSYFVLPLRAHNLATVMYLITDNSQQINKMYSLVYYLDLSQLFLAPVFQYMLIMLQFSLTFKLNSILNIKEL